MSDGLSLNNSWRSAVAGVAMVCSAGMFAWLTINGNPANALHSWAQSGCLTVAVGILACALGFKPLADTLVAMVKR